MSSGKLAEYYPKNKSKVSKKTLPKPSQDGKRPPPGVVTRRILGRGGNLLEGGNSNQRPATEDQTRENQRPATEN